MPQADGFFLRVYETVARIPRGKVATYGQIALLIGSPRASRVVGGALRTAPATRNLPCHRVVNRLGGLAPCGVFGPDSAYQRLLLEQEGVLFLENGCVDLSVSLWRPELCEALQPRR